MLFKNLDEEVPGASRVVPGGGEDGGWHDVGDGDGVLVSEIIGAVAGSDDQFLHLQQTPGNDEEESRVFERAGVDDDGIEQRAGLVVEFCEGILDDWATVLIAEGDEFAVVEYGRGEDAAEALWRSHCGRDVGGSVEGREIAESRAGDGLAE